MPIVTRNMTKGARKRQFVHKIDLSSATAQVGAFVDSDNDILIEAVRIVYSVATDSNTCTNKLKIGTAADDNLLYDTAPAVSKAQGTVSTLTLLSTAAIAAGTAVLVQQETNACSNTGEICVVVDYTPLENVGFEGPPARF